METGGDIRSTYSPEHAGISSYLFAFNRCAVRGIKAEMYNNGMDLTYYRVQYLPDLSTAYILGLVWTSLDSFTKNPCRLNAEMIPAPCSSPRYCKRGSPEAPDSDGVQSHIGSPCMPQAG